MLRVFIKDRCPYSAAVLEKLEALGIPFETLNISDRKVARELISIGGKRQVPFLQDEDPYEATKEHTPYLVDDEVEMYESGDIVEYLERRYGPQSQP